MCHHFLFWVFGALIVSRLIFRFRMRRAFGRGWGGGGCGRRFGRFGGPIDLGAPDAHHRRGRHFRRHFGQSEAMTPPSPPVNVAGSLELNQRQQEIYEEVVAKAKGALPVVSLAEALGIVGREPFDRPALDFLVGSEELVDDFEHLHHSLTAEQRAKLRAVAGA
jgi:hypothetical protein